MSAQCMGCGGDVMIPIVGNDFICACGIRYSATIDPAQTHKTLMRTLAELAELRRRLAAIGKDPTSP